jgi:hypothetical protein
MIDVKALIGQIVPGIIWLPCSGNRLDDWPRGGHSRIERMVSVRRPESSLRFDQEEQQHCRERNNERGANHRRGSRSEWISESIVEDVQTRAKKSNSCESGEAAEGAYQPGANCQRPRRMRMRSPMDDPEAHASFLGSVPASERRLRQFQEVKVAKNGRRIVLFHNAAAGASGIFSLDFAVGFHQNDATTCWMDAMPAFSGFHDHGPFSSLRKNDRYSQRQSQVAP